MRALAGVSFGWLGISMVADGVPALLVPHQVAETGGDATSLGLLTLTAIVLAALAQPFAGALSDRVGRVPVMAAGVGLAVGGLAVLLVSGGLLLGTIVALVGVSTVQAGYQALLPDRIEPPSRGRASGAKGLFDLGGAFLAFAALGALLAAGEAATAAVVLGAGIAGSVIASLLVLRMSPVPAPGERVRQPRRGLDQGSGLVQLIVARFLFLLGIYVVGRFLLLFTADRLGLDADAAAGEAGAALALLTLVAALAALPAGWLADRIGRRKMMLSGGLVGGAGIALLPLADSLVAILAFGSLMAIGTAAFGAASWAALADVAAGQSSGRLLGIANIGTAGAAAGAGLFGPFIDAMDNLVPNTGFTMAFVLAGAVAATGAVVGWRIDGLAPRASIYPALEVPD